MDTERKCQQCGNDMGNEWILGPVCGHCCRTNHANVCDRSAPKPRQRTSQQSHGIMKTNGGKTMTTKAEQAEAKATLLETLKPGDTVYTILRHVSASGMQRVIQPVVIRWDSERNRAYVLYLGWNIAKALGWGYSERYEGVKADGAGMDMGFHLVYSLSQCLFWDPSAESNADAGYSLKQEWL